MRAGHRGRTAWWAVALSAALVLATTAGCRGHNKRAARLASAEPTLELPADGGETIIQGDASGKSGTVVAAAPGDAKFVDRHPMFSAPRDYYNNTNSNKIVKTGAAVVVGVPMGVYGEVKQIFTGGPDAPR
jgi:hypothetical protein